MLSKLLKYEFRATGRIMLPVYLMLAASTGLFCLNMAIRESANSTALNIIRGLVIFLFAVTVVGVGVVTMVLMVYRFYKNFMTDEGYLMFTLPATTDQLIWSKLIVAVVWSIVTFLVIAAAVFLAGLSTATWFSIGFPLDLRELWDYLLSSLTVGQKAAYLAEIFAFGLLSLLRSFLMFYAAIALGHSFANRKGLLSVVFYFAFSIGLNIIGSFGGTYGLISASEKGFFSDMHWTHTLSIGGILFLLLLSAAFYFLTRFTLKKRLNLQ